MKKRKIFLGGLSGGMVMLAWLFVVNAVLPFKSQLIHRVLPLEDQREVHQGLKEGITEPGTFSIPYLPREEEDSFPEYRSQPVFTVIYDGYTHSGGGDGSLLTSGPVVLLAVFLPPILAAWLLSLASPVVLSRYSRRVLFIVAIGVIIAMNDDVLQMSFGPLGEDYLTFLATCNIIAWTLAGLAIAGVMKPGPEHLLLTPDLLHGPQRESQGSFVIRHPVFPGESDE